MIHPMKTTFPVQKLILSALFAALTAIGAFIRIPTPWSAFTLQVLFVYLSGALLGPKYGALAQGVYVALGLFGLPVFTGGGGFSYVLRPTFGFLLSYPFMGAAVGAVCGADAPTFRRVSLACLAGMGINYLIGLPYMGLILNLYMGQAMSLWDVVWSGMIMFLPFDGVKIVITALLAKRLIPVLKRIEK